MTRWGARDGIVAACTALACAGLLVVAGIQPARAADAPTPSPVPSTTYNTRDTPFSLTISPTRLVIGPDEAASDHAITVVNQGKVPVNVEVQKRSFLGGADGSLAFEPDAPYSANNWVTVDPTSFELAPGTSQIVTASVAVPANPDAGDHQVALVFLVPSGETTANVKINRGVATPIYITVPGATDNTVLVGDLAAAEFSAGEPVTVTATVKNTGTVHRDFRGKSALAINGTDAAVFADFTVIRGSTREVTAQWNPPLACICDLNVSVSNADGQSTTETVRVVVFPVVPAILVLVALLLIAGLVFIARRRYVANIRNAAAALYAAGGGQPPDDPPQTSGRRSPDSSGDG